MTIPNRERDQELVAATPENIAEQFLPGALAGAMSSTPDRASVQLPADMQRASERGKRSATESGACRPAINIEDLVKLRDLHEHPDIRGLFPSSGSVEWATRMHREAFIAAGALYEIAGRLVAHPSTFAQTALRIGSGALAARHATRPACPTVTPRERNYGKTAREIKKSSISWDGYPGVYFLLSGDEIIYVGQSRNVYARVHDHRRTVQFDRWAFIACDNDQLLELEKHYIDVFQPKLNHIRA